MSIISTIESVRVDKWLHALGSVAIFAVVHYATAHALWAAAAAVLSHVAKKAYDVIALKSRDWADVGGDIAFGVAGAALAWACLFTR
ncbi:MAG: hypothetical protein KGL35_17430 [Bradyrhizobium sp.]|nr:hypothetical protein [Bradyrhizobium sp.]